MNKNRIREVINCELCEGHGKEICGNPDHGFIHAMPGDIGRLGCPVCGHSEDGLTKYDCGDCLGTGIDEERRKVCISTLDAIIEDGEEYETKGGQLSEFVYRLKEARSSLSNNQKEE